MWEFRAEYSSPPLAYIALNFVWVELWLGCGEWGCIRVVVVGMRVEVRKWGCVWV